MPKLTITIPSYRQPELLERALQGLQDQTFKDFKVVILDDASGVNFESILTKFPYLQIEIIRNETNLGAMKNMLASILHETNTPYILSHHEDDYLKCNYLELAITILDENPAISFVTTTPIWIAKNAEYINSPIKGKEYISFDSADFAHQVLHGTPVMFGSVVYRRTHLISDWKFETYATFCDRYFLGEILEENNSTGALISNPGIYVRDHSIDEVDTRTGVTQEDHCIHLFGFYKKLLSKKYPSQVVYKKITNSFLFSWSGFTTRSSLLSLYKKQKPYELVWVRSLRILGLYSLLTLPLSNRTKQAIIFSLKKFLR